MFLSRLHIALSAVLFVSCSAPVIEKQITIGGDDEDVVQSMCASKDGGFAVGGYSSSQNSGNKTTVNHGILYSDYWIIKFDAGGKIQWQKSFGGNNTDHLTSITATEDGGFITAGESLSNKSGDKSENSRGSADLWIIKLDSLGNKQWDKTIGGDNSDMAPRIKQTTDKGYFISCSSNSNKSGDKTDSSHGDFDMWVIKIDSVGNKQWDKTLGGNKFEFCGFMDIAGDGGAVICGNTASDPCADKPEHNHGVADGWIVKLDMKGNVMWEKPYSGAGDEMFVNMNKTNDKGFILSAFSNSNKGFEKSEDSKGGEDYWIVKIDSDGNKMWDNTIGGKNNDGRPWIIRQALDGGYIIAGETNSGVSGDKTDTSRGYADCWVIKLNSQGKIDWNKTIGGNGKDIPWGMAEISKGHYVIALISGSDVSGDKTDSSRGDVDYWVVFLNE